MKQFNLDEYLKNPDSKIVTRDGRAAKIHCTNYCSSNFPIVAEIEGRNFSETFTKDGHYNGDERKSPNDLFFAPEKREGWINVFGNTTVSSCVGSRIFKSKEDAEKVAKIYSDYVTTIKIEWEE